MGTRKSVYTRVYPKLSTYTWYSYWGNYYVKAGCDFVIMA